MNVGDGTYRNGARSRVEVTSHLKLLISVMTPMLGPLRANPFSMGSKETDLLSSVHFHTNVKFPHRTWGLG